MWDRYPFGNGYLSVPRDFVLSLSTSSVGAVGCLNYTRPDTPAEFANVRLLARGE